MALSFLLFNTTAEYWVSKPFTGHDSLKNVMQHKTFSRIWATVQFQPLIHIPHKVKSKGLLWHCHLLLLTFQKRTSNIAVTVGISALDENTATTKARTLARSYIP